MGAHFEFHVADTKRAKDFYAMVLGWSFQKMPGVDYHLVISDGIGGDNPLTGALITRNAAPHAAGSGPRGAVMTFTVQDVDKTYAKALSNGGAEALPPTDFAGIGRVAYCEDGEGNIFGMIERPKEDA